MSLANIRIPQDIKNKLDEVGRYVAELDKKKGVPYGRAISFLIEKFEEHKNESKTAKTASV
jgi:hypothetical protein